MASTRIMTRIVALALLSLTLLAGSASAECAWVLWGQIGGEGDKWVLFEAFEKMADCKGSRDRVRSRSEKQDEGSKYPMKHHFECFPDTMDPRGPKGKDRVE